MNLTRWIAISAGLLSLDGRSGFAQAQPPAVLTVLGQVESIDAAVRTLRMKTEDGATLTVALSDKGTVVKVAPGDKSLQNAAPIAFDAVTPGDRLMVRGGVRQENRVEGALRVVVMAKIDLAARNEADQRAWRERGIAGTVTAVDPAKGEFSIRISGAAAATAMPPSPSPAAAPAVTVEAAKAALHRYTDTSVKFDDAKPATVQDVAFGDQVRILGKRSDDGARIAADRVVFGSFRTMALAIEKIDPATGHLSVKDLETNKKFTLTLAPGATIRKIPAEMAGMIGALTGGAGRSGGMGSPAAAGPAGGMGAPRENGPPPGIVGGDGRPGGGHGQGGGQGRTGGGRPQGGFGVQDMMDRMPAITLADLKKDDWIGAVVGRIDATGHAVAFNMLAGLEVFASRANRSGGVDVGMPSGLLDGALGVP